MATTRPPAQVIADSHLTADYEALRTRTLRALIDQTALLGDGLHALHAGRTDVTAEFIDRAISALQREIHNLREASL